MQTGCKECAWMSAACGHCICQSLHAKIQALHLPLLQLANCKDAKHAHIMHQNGIFAGA